MIKSLTSSKHNFRQNDGIFVTVYREISEETFQKVHNLSPKQLDEEIEDTMPDEVLYGYGYYGGGLYTDNEGRHYYYFKRGVSCD